MSTPASARSVTKAVVRNVLVRACTVCSGSREQGKPCGTCGNPDPPQVVDLGVQSYYHRNPLRRLGWSLIGQHLAARRARAANSAQGG